ncbi:hypothetical protein Tco_0223170, partial [Tanacetum coccineum]
VPAPAYTRSDDQILPFAAWVPIGKSKYVMDLQKKQKNPIFQIAVDILQNTKFFRAFTASTSLDESWFTLDANLLREALEITLIDQAHPFVSPPSGDAIMDFVNELGYSGARLWGMIGPDIQYFRCFGELLQGLIPTKKGRKDKPHVIPYCRFTKLIICHLGRIHNVHQRSASPFHLAEEDLRLGNLKFVPKGEKDEHDQKVAAQKEGMKKSASTKQSKPKPAIEKSSKPEPAPKPKVTKEKYSKASTAKPPKPKPAKEKSTKASTTGKGKVVKVCNVKSNFQLVDEHDEEPAHFEPELEQEGAGEEHDMERVIQMIEGKGKAIVTEEQAAQSLLALHTPKRRSTTDQFIFQRRTPATEEVSTGPSTQPQDDTSANIVRDSSSLVDAETRAESDKTNSGGDTKILQIGDELGEDVTKQANLEEKTTELDQDQAGSDPGESLESRPQAEQVYMDEDQAGPDPGISRVALVGSDPEPTHDEFMTDLYPKVQESLKFLADEHVILEEPLTTDEEPEKLNVDSEAVSMVTVSIYQASTSVPPMSTPIIDLSPSKSAPSTTQAPIFTTTKTTTTTTLPPPPQQQSITESELVDHVASLEKKLSDLEQNNKNLDNITQNHGSRVFTLELRDLPHKNDEAVCKNVKKAVQIALQASLRDHFRDLPKEDMKEMLHQRMFESGSYKSLPKHIALYEALEASMARAQRDEFLAEKDKSRKRCRDDQDPPPPPDSDLNAPLSSSKQQSGPHVEQPVEDIPISDSATLSDSEDTDSDHLPKTKQRPEWLKPIPEDKRPATSEPAWVIPSSHIPDAQNNWASDLATTYQALTENSLLEKTRDMRTFMNWYCQKTRKTELTQADLEDQIDWANPEGDQVRIDINRPLPLSVTPGHVTIQTPFFFNKDLDYLRYGSKGSRPALSISKMKAAHYPDFGLELLLPEHMWIDDVCTYDINASYGISHWWFNHQKFYIDRHTAESSSKAVRTHMRILSVVRIQAYSRYGYDYLKEIVLRKADYQEYTIAEKDFKNLYPSDFEDLNLLLLQGHLNHLSGSDKRMLSTAVKMWTRNIVIRQWVEDLQLGIESYQTQLNLTKPGWDAKGYEYKHDYTIIDSPRAVVFPVRNNERKIMRFNEIYKFSDGTLTNILEALDYRVKEFKVNRLNPEGSSGTWNALLVVAKKILTTDCFREPNEHIISTLSQNWRNLPRDNPLVSVEVLRYDKRRKSENKGIVPTKMELELEQTQQGSSHEFSISNERVEE